MPASGVVVNGRYRIVRLLGEGGMGSVFLAADLAEDQRPLALKKVHHTLLTPLSIEALKGEFSLMTGLQHPNVVEVFDYGVDAGSGDPFLTLEYVDGENLQQACAGRPVPDQVELLAQVCRGLHYIHARGLIHNDLKPQNILVTSGLPRTCKLTDFGLASLDSLDSHDASRPRGLRGTLPYLAPELIQGAAPDRRSDLYALGVLFYLILAGRLPFEGSLQEMLTAATTIDPPAPRTVREEIPGGVDRLVMRLLSRSAADRPESAAAVLEALNEAIGASHPLETPITIASSARSTRFVGRGREMDRLTRLMDGCATAERPSGRLVMITGESGIGKSRLVRQIRHEAQMRGLRVLTGQCYEGAASAFHPFAQVMRQLEPPAAAGGGNDLMSLLALEEVPGESNPERERRRLIDAAVQRMLAAAESAPVLACVEDLQWADAASLDLLEHLARNAASRSCRLLLAVTWRSEDAESQPLAAVLSRLGRAPQVEKIELTRLGAEQIGELMRGFLGTEEPSEELVATLARETEGNPFFVQMALEGLLEDQSTRGQAAAGAKLRFPRSLSEAIARRLESLDPVERSTMAALAVAESPLSTELLAAIAVPAGETAARLGGAVDRLMRRCLVRQELDEAGAVRLRLDHVKVRDHVYEAMDWQERRELHGRIGLALELAGQATVEELAHHFTHSPDDARALDHAQKAGRQALSLFAPERAVRWLERALELVGPGDPSRRLELQMTLADAFRQGREHARAIETYERVARGARAAGLKDMGWAATVQLLDTQSRAGLYDEAQRGAERIIPMLESEGRAVLQARCLTLLALIAASQGKLDPARDLNGRALELRRQAGDLSGQAVNLHNLGTIHALQGATTEALPLLEEALALHRQVGDVQRTIETLMNLAHWHRLAGSMASAVPRFEEAADMARRARDRWLLCQAETSLAWLYHMQARHDAALAMARRAVSDAQAVGNDERECEALDVLGAVQRELGDNAAAIASHERAVALARRASLPTQEFYAVASASLDRLAASPQEADLRSVRDALRKAARASEEVASDKLKARLHQAMGRCHLVSREPSAALASARRAVEAAAASRAPMARAEAELLHAECLLAPGLPERSTAEAASAARRAADVATEAGLPEPRWRAHALMAVIHREEGRRSAERSELSRAASTLHEISGLLQEESVRLGWLADPSRADVLRRAGSLPPLAAGRASAGRGEATPERALAAMFELSGIINSMDELDTMLERLLDVGLGIVSAERGLIILLNEEGAQEVAAARDLEEETLRDALEYSHSVVKEAAAGQVVVSLDADQDDRFRRYRSVSLYSIKSLMCVPMRVRERIIGTVYVDSRRQGIPFTPHDLRFLEAFANLAASAVEQARLHQRLASENVYLQREALERHRYQNIIGRNVKMQAVYDLMEKVAASNLAVLIHGESGTGKELVARALHYSGPRKNRRFYSENVAAIPDQLLESEMFGHMRGAFTGADRDKKGLFEMADGGTLFLDEIGDMSLPLQAKLLRALQEGEIRPVGSSESRKVDVRIISATNKDLELMMKERRFREDLFFRLNVVRIPLPSLRERKEDIPLLVDHFLTKAARESGSPPKKIDMGTMQLLLRYSWPGNVRELENEIQRLAVLTRGEVITQRDLMENAELYDRITSLEDQPTVTPLEELERRQIEKALMEAGGNRGRAAELLGISRATIFRKLRKFNLAH